MMFRDEWDYLIHLLHCAIHSRQPEELPEGLDFARVYELGAFHHIANIAFYSVEKLAVKPQEFLYEKWKTCRDMAIVRSMNQRFAAEEIRLALQNAGIPWLELQGTRIRPLYPQPDWRTMSDIDLIVPPKDLTEAGQILQTLGYQWEIVHEGLEVAARRPPNINIELHTEYFPEASGYQDAMPPPFTSEVDDNAFYLYNILHIAKHFHCGGCGIRRVLDVYYLNRHYGKRIDRAYIQAALETVDAVELAQELTQLAEGWFAEGSGEILRDETARSFGRDCTDMHSMRSTTA